MDNFKKTNIKLATSLDWNCPSFVTRKSGDSAKIRRYARRKLKQRLHAEAQLADAQELEIPEAS